jgi:predicted dehydrogenase
MTELRIGVIGCGLMGSNHARVVQQLARGHLAAVVDADLARAEVIASPAGAIASAHVDDVLAHIDLAVIAVPTVAHLSTAMACIDAGVNVLIEKPIAGTAEDAVKIISAARDAGVMLAVGHIERFNAAIAELPRLLEGPLHFTATRINPYSPRISDGVVHDLMIHDLDIVAWLAGPQRKVIDVFGVSRATRSDREDLAVATLRFDDGLTAMFETSRLAQQKVRTLEVVQDDSVVVADLLRQDVTIHRMSRTEYSTNDGVRYRQSSVIEVPFLDQRGEPLMRELEDVVAAVLDSRSPRVTGEDGLHALQLADRVSAAVASPNGKQ